MQGYMYHVAPGHNLKIFFRSLTLLSACSEGYRAKNYPALQGVNTQVAEQRHSLLKRLKPMVSYMDSENFVNVVSLFCWFRNNLKRVANGAVTNQHRDQFKQLAAIFKGV